MNQTDHQTNSAESLDFFFDFCDLTLNPADRQQQQALNKELSFLSQCFSQDQIRHFQSIALLLYITYAMIHGLNSLPAFYILAVVNLLPYILFSMTKERHLPHKITFFPQLKKKLRIRPERYQVNRYVSVFVTFLLLLWQIVQARTLFTSPWLTWYPAAIAILSVTISLFGPFIISSILKSRLKQGQV